MDNCSVVKYRVLGPVEVVVDGKVAVLGGPRERALLARLVISANRVVSADALADSLWAGEPPARWLPTLRVYVFRLRRALGPAGTALTTHPPGYRLSAHPDEIDAARFERLAGQGMADLGVGRPRDAAGRLRDALALWHGEPFLDIDDLPFASAEAARLRELRLATRENLFTAELALGRHSDIIAELEGLVSTHRLRERLSWQLMLALYRCGRQADALAAFQSLRDRLADELGIDPGPDIRALHESVLRQDPALDWRPALAASDGIGKGGAADPRQRDDDAGDTTGPRRTGARQRAEGTAQVGEPPGVSASAAGLPAETTTFVGRENELATIDDLLQLSRLVTLTGPSGCGKSRLAYRAATLTRHRYPGGVFLAELAGVQRPELVGPAMAAAVGASEKLVTPLPEVIADRIGMAPTLLVIDNCEHLADAVSEIASRLLRSCPELRILTTSQQLLGVNGEASWPVPPLRLPVPTAAAGDIAAAEAVQLFAERATLARPGFTVDEANAPAVAEICRKLDGIPLAIELAAVRLRTLSTAQLVTRLANRFVVLTGGSRTGLARHQTLRAAIEWSVGMLSERERVCMRRLAVFAGGCTIDAAEAVCPDDALPTSTVLEVIGNLVERSLLTTAEKCGAMRYGMLESIHAFAGEMLDAAGERDTMRGRHLEWLRQFVADADFAGPDQVAWLDLTEAESDNINSAIDWAVCADSTARRKALELVGRLSGFWLIRGMPVVGRTRLLRTLDAAGPGADPRLRAAALDGVGQLSYLLGDTDAQRDYLQQSLVLWRELGDAARTATALGDLATAAHYKGELDVAASLYGEMSEIATQIGSSRLIGLSCSGLARAALRRNDFDHAMELYTQALQRFREAGDVRQTTLILGNLGVVALHMGDIDLARTRLMEQLASARRLGDRRLIGVALTNLGDAEQKAGNLAQAESHQREALGIAEQIGDRRMTTVVLINLGVAASDRGDIATARLALARSITLAHAAGHLREVAEGLGELAAAEASAADYERAAVFFGAAAALRESIGVPVPAADARRYEAALAATRGTLGEQRFTAAEQAGRAMPADTVPDFAAAAPHALTTAGRAEDAGVAPPPRAV